MWQALRSLWTEPRAPNPPAIGWMDRGLSALIVVLAVYEASVRTQIVWRPIALVLTLGLALIISWRRERPFFVFVTAYGAHHLVTLVAVLSAVEWDGLHTSAFILLLSYSLFRWGSGREGVAGVVVILLGYLLIVVSGDVTRLEEGIGAAIVLMFPPVLGSTVRLWANAHVRELEQAKLVEREQIARELHDTVAHHISAITIHAQAGRTLAAQRPEAATDALVIIEEAAARTLAELRGMVRALRRDEAAELAPQPGIADIQRLARESAGDVKVAVELEGDLQDLNPSVELALFRLAQESTTNALRHARRASQVVIRITGTEEVVRLVVHDDGESTSLARGRSSGFGLVGMAERVALLGGSFHAGPLFPRGWQVEASLPKKRLGQ